MLADTWTVIAPALLPPTLIGLFIWWRYRPNPWAQLAGLWTLKPLLATPLFVGLNQWYHNAGMPLPVPGYLLALPGLTLTLALLAFHHTTARQKYGLTLVLLGLDVLRWGSSVWLASRLHDVSNPVFFGGIVAALVLPTVFAFTAWLLLRIP